jgi:hypothetical protein
MGGYGRGRSGGRPDLPLQDAICRKPNGVFDPLGLQIPVDFRVREASVGAEIDARNLAPIPRHDRLQHRVPSIGAGDVAGTKRAPLEVAELVEQEQRMTQNLRGKKIIAEFEWCEQYTEWLTRFSMQIESAFAFPSEYPWPQRPAVPPRV